MDKIILEGMEFFGYHGAQLEERTLGQRFILDVELFLDLRPAGSSDDLDRTINYALVFDRVQSIVCGRSYQLIEALAEAVAKELLEQFPADQVKVRVKKPQAPVPGRFTWLAVEITRGKNSL
ncbi:MAG: dihydroneopterin aldolase [Desulfotomaculaceae bacterium]|nr:dihydroneopterin aldolase [Desulfotomaculaceae bacterium]MDD4766801.1 dihydroneopterin aldolase [Desulfotomaculaceae bacterium]